MVEVEGRQKATTKLFVPSTKGWGGGGRKGRDLHCSPEIGGWRRLFMGGGGTSFYRKVRRERERGGGKDGM